MKARLFLAFAGMLLTTLSVLAPAWAQSGATDLQDEVRRLASSHAVVPAGARVEIEPGQLDPRLRLAPCERVEPYLPPGQRLWGRTRVGLRCTRGPVAWNVYLPITVRVWGQAVVAATPLPAGSELGSQDLRLAEVDLAASPSPAFTDPAELVGRRLAMAVAPDVPVRADTLRARQWFAAGDTVSVVARGDGYAVASEGVAITPGIEGTPARVRVDSGRIVTGDAVGMRKMEVRL